MISEKLFSIIKATTHDNFQLLKSKLLLKNSKELNYWIINPSKNSIDKLDPSVTSFFYLKGIGNNEKNGTDFYFKDSKSLFDAIEINKRDIKINGIESHMPLVIGNVGIKSNLNEDLLAISPVLDGGISFLVSENLKTKIEEAKCTGIVFTELNEKYP